MTDLMIDLETMGTAPGCALVSIGAVRFDREGGPLGPDFYRVINLDSCAAVGLGTDMSTIRWWMRHAEAWPDPLRAVPLPVALVDLQRFIGEDKPCVWSHGAGFDLPILAAAYRACKLPLPWSYRAPRDTRTLFDLAGVEYRTEAHHALEDARAQARAVQEALGKLRGVP